MRTLSVFALTLCCACGDTQLVESPAEPSRSLTQPGPEDIAEFKRTLDAGGVPALSLLDGAGFLADHELDPPPADCGERICAHAMLAVAPRFDEGNWTMAFVALHAAPADAPPARAKHLLVITSGAVSAAALIGDWQRVLGRLAGDLDETDRVSVFASGESQLLAAAVRPDQLASVTVPPARAYDGEGLYAALAGALELSSEPRFADYAQSVVLLTEGVPPPRGVPLAKQEVASPADFEALARRFAERQLPITSIGLLHPAYTRGIPAALSQQSGGEYHTAADATAAADALAASARADFTSVARDLQLTLRAAPGYAIGGVFGANPAESADDHVVVRNPIRYAGAVDAGFFVQLMAGEEGEASEADAFALELRYEDSASRERKTTELTLRTPLGVGHSPPPTAPFFSDPPSAKPFIVLNTYLALREMLRLYAADSCGGVRSIRDMLAQTLDYWQKDHDDSDVSSDLDLVRQLASNIETHCDQPRYKLANAALGCFLP